LPHHHPALFIICQLVRCIADGTLCHHARRGRRYRKAAAQHEERVLRYVRKEFVGPFIKQIMRDKKPEQRATDPLTREPVWQAELLAARPESESKAEGRATTGNPKLPGGSRLFGPRRPIVEARLPSQPAPTPKRRPPARLGLLFGYAALTSFLRRGSTGGVVSLSFSSTS
jgi:hypothetical protein